MVVAYRVSRSALAGAPAIAPTPAARSAGVDFHLTVDGPKLIEVNTTPRCK